ncbi:AAA family ATPase [Stakelama saccharophila]|uniref:AAA family ATPase n=1 Tax=Stakelama saccharophila TaxID=3075605 RepID=A0ABZ0B674_9SPHN|nr:AAA family ATPase [Stakelama sp. W311]WNO52800.1 AAA family ATPase [Stakelama sp. W311]
MNDATPREYRGSLIERGAAAFDYGLPPVVPADDVAGGAAAPVDDAPILRRGDAAVDFGTALVPGTHRRAAIDHDLLAARGMLIPGAPIGVLAEEFRLVKRQLLLTARAVAGGDAGKARKVLVTSANPDEGKTFCAVNLALSMAAEQDIDILLVDADFAKPALLDTLGLPEGPGLLDVLADPTHSLDDCIIDTDLPHLSVLPAGARSNSDTELLASDKAATLLDAMAAADRRRIVIFDSPPVLAASPASTLALHVGQTLLVVRADATSESDLRQSVQMLDGCEHIQLLLNRATFNSGGPRFGSYYGGESPE